MSVYLQCDQCGKHLKIPEQVVGHKIKCPVCEAVFKATADSFGRPNRPQAGHGPRRR